MSDHSINYKGIACAHCNKENCLHFREEDEEVFDCAHCGEHNAIHAVALRASRPIGWICQGGKQGYRPAEFAEAEHNIAEGEALTAKGQRVLDEAGKEE